MRKKLFQTVTDCLKTLTDSETGEKVVKHIDLWQTSITESGNEASFPTPAVFIEFLPATWKTLCGNKQTCEVQLRLHIIEYTAENDTQVALHGFELADRIASLLTEWQLENRSRFLRTESLTNHESEKVRDCMETFKLTI